jgi:hypothetical protein
LKSPATITGIISASRLAATPTSARMRFRARQSASPKRGVGAWTA